MNIELLRDSFERVKPHAADFVGWFYGCLFLYGGEEVQQMFPPLMGAQRDRLAAALVRIIGTVDNLDALVPYLQALGRDHRKFSVRPEHYAMVGSSLLAALEHFLGPEWTAEVAAEWTNAYTTIAGVMIDAADADQDSPAWWDAEVVSRELRGSSVAVLRLRLVQPMAFEPGQSMAVQFPRAMPGVWRMYSPANPPADPRDREPEMTFHVKIEDGGLLSPMLGLGAEPGDQLRLGPPVGSLRLDNSSARDLVLVAGSTGLAPLMSILGSVAQRREPPAVHLFFGARHTWDLYELPALEKLATQHEWLTVTPVVSDAGQAPGYEGARGSVADVAACWADWSGRDVYVCGSTPMVQAAVSRMISRGVPGEQIRIEDFGWEGDR